MQRPPTSTLFPYTTLFRSLPPGVGVDREEVVHPRPAGVHRVDRSEEHTSELQSRSELVCRLLLEKKKAAVVLPLEATTNVPHTRAPPSPHCRPTRPSRPSA